MDFNTGIRDSRRYFNLTKTITDEDEDNDLLTDLDGTKNNFL